MACVGFCMGGGLSALLACEEPEISGAALFYGTTPPPKDGENPLPRDRLLRRHGRRVNAGISGLRKGNEGDRPKLRAKIYEGASHSFFNDTRGAYDVRAARDAFARLLAFFVRTLTRARRTVATSAPECLVMAKPAGPRAICAAATAITWARPSSSAARLAEARLEVPLQRLGPRRRPGPWTSSSWSVHRPTLRGLVGARDPLRVARGESTLLGLDISKRSYASRKSTSVRTQGEQRSADERHAHRAAWTDFLAREGFSVGLSLDGPAEMHDRYRRAPMARPRRPACSRPSPFSRSGGSSPTSSACSARPMSASPTASYHFFKA